MVKSKYLQKRTPGKLTPTNLFGGGNLFGGYQFCQQNLIVHKQDICTTDSNHISVFFVRNCMSEMNDVKNTVNLLHCLWEEMDQMVCQD